MKSFDRQDYDRRVIRNLKVAIMDRGLSITQAASIAKVPRGTLYNNIEKGHAPNCYTLAKLCAALNLDANKVLGVKR